MAACLMLDCPLACTSLVSNGGDIGIMFDGAMVVTCYAAAGV